MTVVRFRSEYASGTPHPFAQVVATLIGPTITSISTDERMVDTRADAAGNWELTLKANSLYGSFNSYYELAIGANEAYTISVPESSAPVSLADCLVNTNDITPIHVVVAVQNFTDAQKAVVRNNLGLGDVATRQTSELSIRSDATCNVVWDLSDNSYPQPNSGYATYRYFGPVDPQTQGGLPFPFGSEWINLTPTP